MKKKSPVILHGYSVMATPFGDSRLIASLPPLLCLLCQSARVSADDYFDPAALEFASPQQKMADLHYFAKSGGQQPGVYSVNIWVNNQDAGQGAITFVEREAAAYDEQAVMENKQRKMQKEGMTLPCGCPGSQSRNIQRQDAPAVETPQAQQTSRLSQWPVQIKLVPVNAPYFDGARLLIAADCTAYAYAAFHERFIKGHITLVGCPKLDGVGKDSFEEA